MAQREIAHVFTGRATSDGAGVKLSRIFGGQHLELFDPFLLLDEFGSDEAADYIGGFPSHPHRGFETVTYMLEGRMLHEDHLGNRGLLQNGDVQWMTAARGIIHSEMPQQIEGRMRGFQLWLNLPAAEKMKDPSYQDIASANIPEFVEDGVTYRLIAGEVDIGGHARAGAVVGLSTQPIYVDVHLPADAQVCQVVPSGHTALVYVYEGSVQIGQRTLAKGQLAVLDRQGDVALKAVRAARVLLLAGKPLNEPIVQHGPYVMNTTDEIDQAIRDYREGRLGR